MRKVYKNPPIIEALCEFQFEQDTQWDLAILGLMYEKVQRDFPIREQARDLSLNIITGQEAQIQSTDRMQYFQKDKNALIQVGRNQIVINYLKPYPKWDVFFSKIKEGFQSYRSVANPKGVNKIVLKYINRILVPSKDFKLDNYLNFCPLVKSKQFQNYGAFIVGIQVPFEEFRDILKIQLTSSNSDKPETAAFILDIEYILVKTENIGLEKALDWVNIAHEREGIAFEDCITDKLREIFEEEK